MGKGHAGYVCCYRIKNYRVVWLRWKLSTYRGLDPTTPWKSDKILHQASPFCPTPGHGPNEMTDGILQDLLPDLYKSLSSWIVWGATWNHRTAWNITSQGRSTDLCQRARGPVSGIISILQELPAYSRQVMPGIVVHHIGSDSGFKDFTLISHGSQGGDA